MSVDPGAELLDALRGALRDVGDAAICDEQAPVLPAHEVEGLLPRLRAGVTKAIEVLERSP